MSANGDGSTRMSRQQVSRMGGKAVSKDRGHMSRIGRIGGLRSRIGPKKASLGQVAPEAQEPLGREDPDQGSR